MEISDYIIISFTSWKKRINNCAHIFELFLNQTLLPNKIILNLSAEEFEDKEKSLPKELIDIINSNNICEINWVKENTTVWKKFIPVMNKYPDAVILTADDDIEYPINYVEEMYKCFLKWDKQCPIVCYHTLVWQFDFELYCHSGAFSLVKKEFFNNYIDELYNNVVIPSKLKWQSDTVYTIAALLNNKRYKLCTEINGNNLYDSSVLNKINAYSNYSSKEHFKRYYKCLDILDKYLIKTYNKSITDNSIVKAPIVVNITTWPKRDMLLPKMLKYFKQQIIKPDKIILWLSEEEYNINNLPKHLIECKNNGLITEIQTVSGKNTYAHKKWETFKYNNGCYNIMCDDDIYYNTDYIEKLLESAYKHNTSVICYYTQTTIYKNNLRCKENIFKNIAYNNDAYSGLSCYPPYVFPIESYKYNNLRDKYVTRCDDSWINSWLIHNNTQIIGLYPWNGPVLNKIEGEERASTWVNHNSKLVNGTLQKVINMATALSIVDYKSAKNLWPEFDIINNSLYINDENKFDLQYILVAIVRNENRYLDEWINYYKRLGITHIVLIDNNFISGEHIENVIYDDIISGYVEIINKRVSINDTISHLTIQQEEYLNVYNKYKNKCKWMAFFDIDEFLYIVDDITLPNFLNQDKFKNVNHIMINWKNYNDNDLTTYDSRPVQARFVQEAPNIEWLRSNYQVKSIIRGNNNVKSFINIHKPILENNITVDADGKKISYAEVNRDCKISYITYKSAYLKHYVTKTIEEYLQRYTNRFNTMQLQKNKIYTLYNINEVKNNFFAINKYTEEKNKIIQDFNFNIYKNTITTTLYNNFFIIYKNENSIKLSNNISSICINETYKYSFDYYKYHPEELALDYNVILFINSDKFSKINENTIELFDKIKDLDKGILYYKESKLDNSYTDDIVVYNKGKDPSLIGYVFGSGLTKNNYIEKRK